MDIERKQGVYITEHKKWNTKKIFNNGCRMCTYRHQPKVVDFNYPFINDRNQDYCGGWSIHGVDYSKEAQLMRVIEGLKPFISIAIVADSIKDPSGNGYKAVWTDKNEAEKQKLFDIAEKYNHIKYVGKMGGGSSSLGFWYFFEACFDTTLGELVGLQKLEQVYRSSGILVECVQKKDKPLSDYFDEFDCQGSNGYIEPWETGLVLGYPIENTISWYLESIQSFGRY